MFGWVVSILYVAFYAFFVLLARSGWRKLKSSPPASGTPTHFSVLIAARNEASNIQHSVRAVLDQDYPATAFEVLVIDDFSSDETARLVTEMANPHLRLLQRTPDDNFLPFKKGAIQKGVAAATGDWIITTDADCLMGPHWLSALDRAVQEGKADLLSGPVVLSPATSLFGGFQQLEFASLNGIGAASLALQRPTMCNGANLAYRKAAFYELGGYQGNDHLASGDDEFLMHKMHMRRKGSVRFVYDPEALITTPPQPDLKSFYRQRKRWVSKSTEYDLEGVTYALIAAYLFNVLMLYLLIAPFFGWVPVWLSIVVWGIKIGAEYLFLRELTRFYGISKQMRLLIPEQVLHVLYVLIIGISSRFKGYEWKGRRVR